MLTTNALVTYTDLTIMGLVPKGTPATGNRIATVSFINSNYYVNQSASPYNTYTSLRCPPYQSIIAGPTNSGTMYYLTDYGGGNIHGFNTPAEACAHATGGSVTVYWSGTFGNGTTIYLDPNGITQLDGFNYFSLGGYSFGADVSVVTEYQPCPVSYTINWTNNNITTGTNNLQISKNSSLIVNQNGLGSGSFSVISTDVITYSLSSTTPNFTSATISVNSFGPNTVSDCNFNSAYASNLTGITFAANGTIDGITVDYVDGCP